MLANAFDQFVERFGIEIFPRLERIAFDQLDVHVARIGRPRPHVRRGAVMNGRRAGTRPRRVGEPKSALRPRPRRRRTKPCPCPSKFNVPSAADRVCSSMSCAL